MQMQIRLDDCGDVLTVREVARVLRINRDSAYGLVHSGALAHFKCGRSIRVPKVAVLRLLSEDSRSTPDATNASNLMLTPRAG